MVILARIRLYEAPHEAADCSPRSWTRPADDRLTLAVAHEGAAACCLWIFQRFDEALRHLADRSVLRWSWATRLWLRTPS